MTLYVKCVLTVIAGLLLVLDVFSVASADGLGVLWALGGMVGCAFFFVVSSGEDNFERKYRRISWIPMGDLTLCRNLFAPARVLGCGSKD